MRGTPKGVSAIMHSSAGAGIEELMLEEALFKVKLVDGALDGSSDQTFKPKCLTATSPAQNSILPNTSGLCRCVADAWIFSVFHWLECAPLWPCFPSSLDANALQPLTVIFADLKKLSPIKKLISSNKPHHPPHPQTNTRFHISYPRDP